MKMTGVEHGCDFFNKNKEKTRLLKNILLEFIIGLCAGKLT